MAYSPLPPMYNGSYSCDKCRGTGGNDSHYRCSTCNEDFCPKCAPPPPGSVPPSQNSFGQNAGAATVAGSGSCPRGHALTLSSLGEGQGMSYHCEANEFQRSLPM
jgi:hypothetical protein